MATTKVTFSGDDADLLSSVVSITDKLKELKAASDEAKRGLSDLGDDGKSASSGVESIGEAATSSSGGLTNLIGGMQSAIATGQQMFGMASQAYQFVDGLNATGSAAIRAKNGLDAMTGGQADKFIAAMQASTNGLIPAMDEAAMSTKALSTGVVKTSEDMARLAHDGAVLGLTFQGSADGGIQSLEQSLMRVGSYRGLTQLGLNISDVREEFGRLSQSMSKQDAWGIAVMDAADARSKTLGSALDGVGTHWEHLKTIASDIATEVAKWATEGLDKAIVAGQQLIGIFDTISGNKTLQGSGPTDDEAGSGDDIVFGPDGKAHYANSAMGKRIQAAKDAANLPQVSGNSNPSGQSIWEQNLSYRGMLQDQTRDQDPNAMPQYMQQLDYSKSKGRSNYNDADLGSAEANAARDKQVARERLNDLLKFGSELTKTELGNAKELVGSWQQAALAADAAAKAKKAMTTDQAFGVQGASAIETQQSGVMQAGLAAARQAQYAELQKKYGTQGADQRITTFDQQSQAAMDKYAVATGAATNESIKFRNMNGELAKGLADGKLTIDQYSAAMLKLARDTENGATSMSKLIQNDVQLNDQLYGNNKTKSGTPDRAFGGANLGKITANGDSDNDGMKSAIDAEVEKAKKIRDARDAAMEQAAAWNKVTTNTAFAAVAMDAYSKAYAAYKALQNAPDPFTDRTPGASTGFQEGKGGGSLLGVGTAGKWNSAQQNFGGIDMSKMDTSKLDAVNTTIKSANSGATELKGSVSSIADVIAAPLAQAAKAFAPLTKVITDNITLAQQLLNTNGNVFITVNSSSNSGGGGGGGRTSPRNVAPQ